MPYFTHANDQQVFQPLSTSQIQAQLNNAAQKAQNGFNNPIAYLDANYASNNDISVVNETNKQLQQPSINFDDDISIEIEPLAELDNIFDDALIEQEIDEQTQNIETTESQQQKQPNANSKPNIFTQAYATLFNDGQVPLPKIETNIYIYEQPKNKESKLIKINENVQPIQNIKAAINNFTIDSIPDFTAALPRIRETAQDAAEAVGYYDVKMSFTQPGKGKIDVLIESLGEPVLVDNRILDIRGEGANFNRYQDLTAVLPLKEGEVFNHQAYAVNKAAIEETSTQYGFFDGKWLNSSADVILPDNIADVNLIYDTAKRYEFDEVVFVTRDPETGKLTQDPNKLPVNIDLLRQMVNFKINDGYEASKITELNTDLFATRYFDGINIEVVKPKAKEGNNDENGAINFEEGSSDAVNSINNQLDEENLLLVDNNKNTAAIEFTIDEATIDKLLQVENKANRLYSLPDNQLLLTSDKKAENTLEKLSNTLTDVVEQILPHDDANVKKEQSLLTGVDSSQNNELPDKKTAEQAYNAKKVPIYVFVESQNPRDAEVGIGWGTDTGTRIRAKIDQNLMNKQGYQAGAETSWSEVKQGVTLYASRPWKHPLDDVLNANLSYEREVLDQGEGNFDLNTRSALAGVSRNIINDNGWNRTYSLRFRFDELETGVESTKFDSLPVKFAATGNANQRALLMGYALNKTVTDDITDPNVGWRQYYSLEGGVEGAGTDTNLLIARAGASGIRSFGDTQKHQVIGKVDTGYLWSDNFEKVPYQLRFFAGGDQSIRGFDYNSLSPIENSYLTGGEILATASAEYNYEVKEGLRAAVFTDVGNAYDTDFTTDTKVGVGTGIRWLSPIGLIRLDVAAGVSEESIPIRLHFYIGSPL